MLNASRRALWFAVTLCTVNLSACNTVKGLGTDMQNLGHKIASKIDQKDSSDATNREVRLEPKSSEHREDQEREGTNPDDDVDSTQNELDRMYEEQMQRRAH